MPDPKDNQDPQGGNPSSGDTDSGTSRPSSGGQQPDAGDSSSSGSTSGGSTPPVSK